MSAGPWLSGLLVDEVLERIDCQNGNAAGPLLGAGAGPRHGEPLFKWAPGAASEVSAPGGHGELQLPIERSNSDPGRDDRHEAPCEARRELAGVHEPEARARSAVSDVPSAAASMPSRAILPARPIRGDG